MCVHLTEDRNRAGLHDITLHWQVDDIPVTHTPFSERYRVELYVSLCHSLSGGSYLTIAGFRHATSRTEVYWISI
jgi:hypothetical protein